MANGIDPIDDGEELYRRIPECWFDPLRGTIDPAAFGPHKDRDTSGLSVTRAKHKSIQDAARGQSGKKYYIAVLRAGDLRRNGITIEPRPETEAGTDPAHAELPELNSAVRKADITLERQNLLADALCIRIEGPFQSPFDVA